MATILPENQQHYIGNLIVLLQNSGKIKKNQKVLIKLDNSPFQEYGMLEGRIQTMSTITDKDGDYFIEITMPNGLKTNYDKKLKFDKELIGIRYYYRRYASYRTDFLSIQEIAIR